MALEDDLKARASALVSQQMANWVVEIQRSIQGHQASLVAALDKLGEDVARYDERIDDNQIAVAIAEVLQQSGAGAGGGAADYSTLKASIAAIEQGGNLSEVLTHLVNEVGRQVERAAMFIVKSQAAVGWYASGFDNPEAIKTISIPLSADTVFRLAANSRSVERGHIRHTPGTGQALARLGGSPQGILAIPLILRDKVAAILYCDGSANEIPPPAADAAEILVAFAAKVIDVLSAAPRQGSKGGTLTGRSMAPAPAPSPPPVPAPTPSPAASGSSESPQTVMYTPGTMRPQPAPPVARPGTAPPQPAPAPPPVQAPPPAAPATPDVRAMSPEEQKAHDDARRFARLVVSEIKLYNEAKVTEGRQTRDIYGRLREDIERGRQMYNDRVGADVRETTDYFQDELVRILAGGDAGALGA